MPAPGYSPYPPVEFTSPCGWYAIKLYIAPLTTIWEADVRYLGNDREPNTAERKVLLLSTDMDETSVMCDVLTISGADDERDRQARTQAREKLHKLISDAFIQPAFAGAILGMQIRFGGYAPYLKIQP